MVKHKIRSYSYLIIFFLLLSTPLFSQELIFSPLTYMDISKPYLFQVGVKGVTENVSVKVVYRYVPEGPVLTLNLRPEGEAMFQGTLLHSVSSADIFEYAIELSYDEGGLARLPKEEAATFYSVPVRNQFDAKISFLAPTEKEVIRQSTLFVAISVIDPDKQFDLASFDFFINDVSLTSEVLITETLISFQTTTVLTDGVYKLRYRVQKNDGTWLEETRVIEFRSDEDISAEEIQFKYSGLSRFEFQKYSGGPETSTIIRDPEQTRWLNRINLTYGFLNTDLRIIQDSRERQDRQPYHRNSVSVYDTQRIVDIRLGDINSSLDPLTMDTLFHQGADYRVDMLGVLGLNKILTTRFFQGFSKRAVGTENVGISAGTYQQRVTGMQLASTIFGFKNAVNYVTYLDLLNSIPTANRGSSLPVENHVFSVENKLKLWGFQSQFLGAGTIHYTDSSAEEIDVSELSLPIPDNIRDPLLSYFPPRPGMSVGAAAKWFLNVPLYLRGWRLSPHVYYAMPGYTNLGDFSTSRDNFEYGTKFYSQFFDRFMSFRLGATQQKNNVLNSQTYTRSTQKYSADSTISFRQLCDVFMGYYISDGKNDAVSLTDVDDSVKVSNQFTMLSGGLNNLNVEVLDLTHKLTISMSSSSYQDAIIITNNYTTTGYAINSQTEFAPWVFNYGLNYEDNKLSSDLPNTTTYMGLNLLAYYDINNNWKLRSGIRYSSGFNNGLDTVFNTNSSKYVLKAGSDYLFKEVFDFAEIKVSADLSNTISTDKLDTANKSTNYSDLFGIMTVSSTF